MKVTWIWRSLAFMFLGMSLGVVLSTLIFINNIPPGTEISVGKVKLKGRGSHTIENIISTEDIITESKKEARQRKRREKK